jgi:competence protein ComEA
VPRPPLAAAPSEFAAGLIVCAVALLALAHSPGHATSSATLQRAAPRPVSQAGVRALRVGEPLDLNAAVAGDLQLLPGVGPKLAQRIVDERMRRGGFRSLDELSDVKGVGPKTLEHVRALVTVRPIKDPTTKSR